MQKLKSERKTLILKYLRSLPGKECEDLLNYIFIIKDPETGKNINLKMHRAIALKIQHRVDKQIVDLCKMQSIPSLRDYLDRALLKIDSYLIKNNVNIENISYY